jgi:hypothetical protein
MKKALWLAFDTLLSNAPKCLNALFMIAKAVSLLRAGKPDLTTI